MEGDEALESASDEEEEKIIVVKRTDAQREDARIKYEKLEEEWQALVEQRKQMALQRTAGSSRALRGRETMERLQERRRSMAPPPMVCAGSYIHIHTYTL